MTKQLTGNHDSKDQAEMLATAYLGMQTRLQQNGVLPVDVLCWTLEKAFGNFGGRSAWIFDCSHGCTCQFYSC